MTIKQTNVERWSLTSARPFEAVVTALEGAVAHPDVKQFINEVGAAPTYAAMEAVVQRGVGESGFMEFARLDLGSILRKERGPQAPRSMRFLIGNPLIMKEMLKHVPDAGSYAPVTVLVDERADSVHVSYDTMAGFLAPYGSAEALKVARELDAKMESLLRKAAA